MDKRTLSEQVYQSVRSDILSNRLPPGSELSEVALAESFAVSRGPVREALRKLGTEGLVLERPRRGAIVASLSKKEFADAYEVRSSLEVLAVTLGTPLPNNDALDRIDVLIETMNHCVSIEDEEEFFAANRQLHREICALADNEMLLTIYDRLMNTMERYAHRSAVVRGDLASSVDEHRAIVDAIRSGDIEKAALLTKEHVSIPLRKVRSMSEKEWEALH